MTTSRSSQEDPGLLVALKTIETRAAQLNHLRAISEKELALLIKPQLIGRTVKARSALYVISDVALSWDGHIEIKGRKVLVSGNWGRTRFHLGRLYARNLVPLLSLHAQAELSCQ